MMCGERCEWDEFRVQRIEDGAEVESRVRGDDVEGLLKRWEWVRDELLDLERRVTELEMGRG